MANALSPVLKQQFFGLNGLPLANGQLTSYQAGTTVPQATYNASGGVNANPVVLDAFGRADVWLPFNVGYKFNLQDQYGNQIPGWPIDQVYSWAQLTLYGGTDTGNVNAYVLNFSTTYTAYANGWVIYFLASNTNTGASTIDVNGLGAVPILNPNGTALAAGQILSNAITQVLYFNGAFLLLSVGATIGNTIGTFGPEATLASANVTDLGTASAHVVNITGSSVITSLGSSASVSAPIYAVRFSGSPTITYNSSTLITPAASNIMVTQGDSCLAEYLGGGAWKILIYQSVLQTTLRVMKTAATSIASSTAVTSDSILQLVVGASGSYFINGVINDAGGTSPGGLKATIAFSGTANAGYWSMQGVGTGVTNVPLTALGTPAELQSTQGGSASMNLTGTLLAGSTGTLSFEWAQESSNATASLVSAGSYLSLTQVSAAAGTLQPVTYTYNVAGTYTQTIPSGYTTMTVEVWGASGNGGTNPGSSPPYVGYGGGSGGYSKTVISVSGDGGETVSYTVGAIGSGLGANGNASSVSSGTFSIPTMTANGGEGGGSSAGGAGGTASGGGVNVTGNTGSLPTGAAGVVGVYGTGNPGGYGGQNNNYTNGGAGIVVFHFA